MGAACVGLDLVFENPDPPEDAQLAAAMQRAGNVYFGVRFNEASWVFRDVREVGPTLRSAFLGTARVAPGRRTLRTNGAALPPETLARAARGLGSVTVFPDRDGILRHFPLVVLYQPPAAPPGEVHLYASLPLVIAAHLLEVPLREVRVRLGDAVEIGRCRVPIDASGQMVVNYYGGYHALHQLSFVHVVHDVKGRYLPEYFRGRAVVLGNTVPGGFDSLATPYEGRYPGVEAEATVLQNILDGSAIRHAPRWLDLLLLFGGALLVGWFRPRPALQQAAGAAVLAVAVVFTGYYLLAARFLWVSVAAPVGGIALAWALVGVDTYREAQWERARAQGALETLAQVTQAIAHTHSPRELVPALERGIAHLLGARDAALCVSDAALREYLHLDRDAAAVPAGAGVDTRLPLEARGEQVGYVAVRGSEHREGSALAAAATHFASLALQNSALFEESRSQFLNLTRVLAEIIEARDRYTAGHCERVMEVACAIAERLGMPRADIEEL
ncbi:MAG: CHASE2 domain-containing protein, partial [Armatimonadota bacterium]|nr:CHASE2 domain-containing protein [Armatimonadota bacterium]